MKTFHLFSLSFFQIINFRIVLKLIGRNLLILSVALLSCSVLAGIYKESTLPFIFSSLIAFIPGVLFQFFRDEKGLNGEIKRKEAFFLVTTSWFMVSLVGSLPYLFSGSIPSFPDAFFESVSGFTTTGSSILTEIESLPKSVLFWRSLTHWIGGIGIVVLFIIIMPSLHEGGYQLFTLESSFQEKIQPRIKSVGQRLAYIYVTLTVVEVFMLLAGGMNLFESVCHAFGTIATGGFSPKNSSIAGYSPYIQYVIMVFMLLSGTNFIIHYYLIKKAFSSIKKNEEVKFYYLLIFFFGTLLAAVLYFTRDKSLEESFRESFFQVISIITCTGYATADYLIWPSFAWIIILFLMFFGGSTGSTAGGIKIARHVIVTKNLKRQFNEYLHPHAIIQIKLNGNAIGEATNKSILTYVTTYLLILFSGSMVLVGTGLDGFTSLSAAATAMAGIGPGVGTIGPAANFAHLSDFAKMFLTLLMVLGRLEIYTVLILFAKSFWRD